MEKRVLVPVADGSEEIESVTIIDVLVRAGETTHCIYGSCTGGWRAVITLGLTHTYSHISSLPSTALQAPR